MKTRGFQRENTWVPNASEGKKGGNTWAPNARERDERENTCVPDASERGTHENMWVPTATTTVATIAAACFQICFYTSMLGCFAGIISKIVLA